jgi:hypothetical protein
MTDEGISSRGETMKNAAAVLTTLAAIAAAVPVLANDQDLRATTVPATACQPATNPMAALVQISNAAWTFAGNSTGTVYLYCPLPINGNTVSGAGDDNDMTALRIYYRDSDGTGNAAEVRARLIYRRSDGLYSGGAEWSSNSNLLGTTTNTRVFHLNAHDLTAEGVYSILVTLRRTNSGESAVISGFDFATVPETLE